MKLSFLFIQQQASLTRKIYAFWCLGLLGLAAFISFLIENEWANVFIALLFVLFVYFTVLRLKTIGWNGWWALLLPVPIVNVVVGIYILLKK